MAEEKNDAPAETPTASSGKKFDLMTIVLLVSSLATIAAAGAVLYTKILFKKQKITESQELTKIQDQEPGEGGEETDGPLVQIDEMRVNIASPDGGNHFAFFSVTAECSSAEAASQFAARKDQLVDRLISLFNRKKAADINHVQGRLIMKEEILKEFNAVLGDGAVRDIYFPTFMVQ